MNTETEHHDPRVIETAEKAVHTLFDVGRLWAAHGLNVGRSALKTSAQTLQATSSLLGELADRFAEEHDQTEQTEPAEDGQAIEVADETEGAPQDR